MSRLPGKVTPRFVELTERRAEFVVCSRVEWWVSHWDTERRRSRRCGGLACALCAIGSPKVIRFVVMAVDDRGRECLIEFRERHRQLVERLEATIANGSGVRVVGRKEGGAKNSPCNWVILGEEDCFRREIACLVATFGLPALEGPGLDEPEGMNVEQLEPSSESG